MSTNVIGPLDASFCGAGVFLDVLQDDAVPSRVAHHVGVIGNKAFLCHVLFSFGRHERVPEPQDSAQSSVF